MIVINLLLKDLFCLGAQRMKGSPDIGVCMQRQI